MACRSGRHVGMARWSAVGLAIVLLALMLGHAPALGGAAAPAAKGEPAFAITEFQLAYGGVGDAKHALHGGHPGLPPVAELMQMALTLGKVADGYVATRPGVASVTVRLAGVPKLPVKKFYASAIQSINQQLLACFNRQGLVGIFVSPHPEDILEKRSLGADGQPQVGLEDRRGKRTTLRIVIWAGVVTEVRTLASGKRIPISERVGHPRHQKILTGSPLQPAAAGAAERDDLLRKRALERYIYWLSRHPGRRVDIALSSADKPGGVVLDYLVTESKPWFAYAQVSNTGTINTRRWRERFGFVHNQLTGRDDILTLDYVTAGFDEAHAVLASYEAPFFNVPRLRWKVYGSWSEYTASDVGRAKQEFDGESWMIGAEVIGNVFQCGRFFVDAVGGARWEDHEVEHKDIHSTGKATIFVPYIGLRFDRIADTASTWGSVMLEWTESGLSHMPRHQLTRLGRYEPDRDGTVLKFDANHSFYLEPLINPGAWADPGSYRSSTLAHEIYFAARGQYAMGDRLIPQHEYVAGGIYTVRGYPESIVAGDSAYVFTAEYRFHVPRILKPYATRNAELEAQKKEADAGPAKLPLFNTPFKFAPQQVYGRPDWDLILRAFYDIGRVVQVHRQTYETDSTIEGVGVGFEFRFKSNISVRCDYAVTLDSVNTGNRHVSRGDNRIHAVFTFSY